MKRNASRHEINEIVVFLVNLFFLEVTGKFLVAFVLFLFRLFGMESVSATYYALPHHSYYTFFIILCIVTLISIVRIIKTQRK